MRNLLSIVAIAVTFSVGRGEPVKRTATVEHDGVEMLSGPALNFPAVGILKKGDSVIILGEAETKFYSVQPPPGSTSWMRAIHLGKIEADERGRANVPVMIDGADVFVGMDSTGKPSQRVSIRLPRGTIVETIGAALRIDNTSWYSIVPPEGDVRWVLKSTVKLGAPLGPPAPYDRTGESPFTVASGGAPAAAAPPGAPAASLPRVLTDHKLYEQAVAAERANDFVKAKNLYARIYQDLWDQKAERDAIVICYNRYTRCDEIVKRGDGRSSARRDDTVGRSTEAGTRNGPTPARWVGPGEFKEVQRVTVDRQQVFALHDSRGDVLYYATAVEGINLRTYVGKRVQLYGVVQERPELFRPHLAVERVEVAK